MNNNKVKILASDLFEYLDKLFEILILFNIAFVHIYTRLLLHQGKPEAKTEVGV